MSGHPDRPEAQSADLIDLFNQFILGSPPIRSGIGSEFVAKAVRDWIGAVGAKTAYIERSGPWENGFIESFSARLRDELLVIESWRRHYNAERPDGSLGYKPPAPEVFIPALAARGFATPTSAAARASREPNHQLTFAPDQSLGLISLSQCRDSRRAAVRTSFRQRRNVSAAVSAKSSRIAGVWPPRALVFPRFRPTLGAREHV